MKRNAILHSHGQGKLRIQEAIEEFKNQLDPFFFFKKMVLHGTWTKAPVFSLQNCFPGCR